MNHFLASGWARLAVLASSLAIVGGVLASNASAAPARVILIRHAEKPTDDRDPHLSARGHERAEALVGFFTSGKSISTNPPIAALYAARPTRDARSMRTEQTLAPLSRRLGLEIRQPFANVQYKALAKQILADGKLDGRTVVICWPHDELPKFAEAFGANPKPKGWKGEVFDRAWVISFDSQKKGGRKVRCETVQQRLLAGDEGGLQGK